MPKIFISHSSKNKDIANSLTSLILSCYNIQSGDLICTSVAGNRLPNSSENYYKDICNHIQESDLIIYIISKDFNTSEDCHYELAWGFCKPIDNKFFFAVRKSELRKKPMLYALTTMLRFIHSDLTRLKARLNDILNQSADDAIWAEKADVLVKCAAQTKPTTEKKQKTKTKPKTTALPESQSIADNQQNASGTHSSTIRLKKNNREQTKKAAFYAANNSSKTKASSKDNSHNNLGVEATEEKYQQLVTAAATALNKLRSFTKWSIFSINYAETGPLNNGEFGLYASDYKEAKQRNEMSEDSYNDNNTRVMDAIDTLRELDHFINSDSNIDFISSKGKKLGTEVSLRNKDYWNIEF